MKKTIKFFAIAVAAFGFAAGASAQGGIDVNTTAEAHIITPLTVDKIADMDFGNVGVVAAVGTIVLATDANRTGTGGATPATPTGTVTAAEFDITGASGAEIAITIQGGPVAAAEIVVTHVTVPTESMNVNTFVTDPVSPFALTGGSATILIGATLNTGISQLEGDYHTTDDFVVNINYY